MYLSRKFALCREKSSSGAGSEKWRAGRCNDGEFKHYGNWYGNRLAVTIYVNAKTLLSSRYKSSALC
jgi:hypothetical protein